MKKLVLFAVILLSVSAMTMAQDNFPRVEVFGGYSYLRCDNTFFGDRNVTKSCNYDGFEISATANGSKWLGFEGDVSAYKDRVGHFGKHQVFSFLVGPRFSVRTGKTTMFLHALIGDSRVSPGLRFPYDNSVTLALGGGFDFVAYKNISVRPVQIDYYTVREGLPFTDNIRYSAGVVFRFGEIK